MLSRVLDSSHHQAQALGGGRYRVTANFQAAADAGAAGFINRSNYGLTLDVTAAEHNRRALATGKPTAFYWYPLSRKDPLAMAEMAFAAAGSRPHVRGHMDLEESLNNDGAEPVYPRFSEDLWRHANSGLLLCDQLTGEKTGIYSSATYMDAHYTLVQQLRWADEGRPGWWAHYHSAAPGIPWVPLGWKHAAIPWVMWQDKIGSWPGYEGVVDQSVVGMWVRDLSEIFGSAGTASAPPVLPPAAPGWTPTELAVIDGVANKVRAAAEQLAKVKL
jgi:hypothetical protein